MRMFTAALSKTDKNWKQSRHHQLVKAETALYSGEVLGNIPHLYDILEKNLMGEKRLTSRGWEEGMITRA